MPFLSSPQRFQDRRDAGRQLAGLLTQYKGESDLLVLALPRGGVPVAYEVAQALSAPLDVFLVRKLGVPGHEELAMGAIASGGVRVINEDVVSSLWLEEQTVDAVAAREMQTLEQREKSYRGERPRINVRGRMVILVDDGLATGASMRAAISALRKQEPRRLIVAVPVAPPEACHALEPEVDEIVCVMMPRLFLGVGRWYEDFSQTTDDEVRELLESTPAYAPPDRDLHATH
jgi:predicted phosphoribosyltransferase